jgi:hypothetical protein
MAVRGARLTGLDILDESCRCSERWDRDAGERIIADTTSAGPYWTMGPQCRRFPWHDPVDGHRGATASPRRMWSHARPAGAPAAAAAGAALPADDDPVQGRHHGGDSAPVLAADVVTLDRRVEHAALAQDLAARSENFAIAERLAAQARGDMLDKQLADSRVERLGAAHDLGELLVSERERLLVAACLRW